ncbi:DEAD-box ATP-dependent RNA helicase 25 [Termitomyces sp. J132]|nr:DEAD-box ATP-dependent RNA helicase 25 [Termitomyces sp. J132]
MATKPPPPPADSSSSRHFSDRTFQSAPISQQSKKAIKHQFMSDVQAATIDLGLAGKDLLVQAKTGTGKTMAFLLPAIERLAKAPQPLDGISMLVLAPTRELAIQIEQEAVMLLQHHTNITVGHIIGGTKPHQTLHKILNKPPTILIATPGRLHDHLTTPETADDVRAQFKGLKTLVYDEADRLLDQGFKRDLDGILSALPDRRVSPRQVMLFSATVSKDIREIAGKALSKDHEFVSTLLEDEANAHEHVPQTYIVTPFANTFPTLLNILRHDRLLHANSNTTPAKPLQTARQKQPPFQIQEAVLVSSDVTARGMDFPGVTLVVQVGIPSSPEQYIHRLGRTARAGKSGRGIIVLDPCEKNFISMTKEMRALAVQPTDPPFETVDLSSEKAEVARALPSVQSMTKEQAYRAWLGYYKTFLKVVKWDREELVRRANAYVREALGWEEEDVPGVEPMLVGRMQMRGVPGLNIVRREVTPGSKPKPKPKTTRSE